MKVVTIVFNIATKIIIKIILNITINIDCPLSSSGYDMGHAKKLRKIPKHKQTFEAPPVYVQESGMLEPLVNHQILGYKKEKREDSNFFHDTV